jgi:hypothetical protein
MMNCDAMNQTMTPKNDLKRVPPARWRGLPSAVGALVSGGRSRVSQLRQGAGDVGVGAVGDVEAGDDVRCVAFGGAFATGCVRSFVCAILILPPRCFAPIVK